MRHLSVFTLGCIYSVILFSSNCGSHRPDSTAASPHSDTKNPAILEQSSKDLGWKGLLSFTPVLPASGKETQFTLKLFNARGAPIKDAQVRFSLLMPLMDMEKSEFDATSSGDGSYRGKGRFTMDGIWIVQANIEQENQRARLEFEIHVTQP